MNALSPFRARLEQQLLTAARELAAEILAAAIADAPVGDPAEDPDPEVSIANSGHVEIERVPGGVVATIGFDTPYALKQHENFRLSHPRGGGPKFLERNVTARVDDVRRAARRAVEKAR